MKYRSCSVTMIKIRPDLTTTILPVFSTLGPSERTSCFRRPIGTSPIRRSAGSATTGWWTSEMALSRDGANWSRLSRDPYVSLGTEDEADSRQMYMAVGMVRRGKRIFQYYGGCRTSHGEVPSRPGPINRLEQRLDGFVSADAAFESGEFTTPTLAFTGTRLVLNINASAMGTCNVEILDGQGHAFPGFSLADCDEIGGNYVEKTVSWKGKTDLSLLSGRPVRLRFAARACKVFAFQFPN